MGNQSLYCFAIGQIEQMLSDLYEISGIHSCDNLILEIEWWPNL
jgi:hypothetical protein